MVAFHFTVDADFRQEFTNNLINLVEWGKELPWEKPWHTLHGLPRSAVSGKAYSGGNRVILGLAAMERGYSDPRWVTYKQAHDLGGYVRKGEKGVYLERWDTIPFWQRPDREYFGLKLNDQFVMLDTQKGVDDHIAYLDDGRVVKTLQLTVQHGNKDYTWEQALRSFSQFYSTTFMVFNVEQCSGLQLEPLPQRQDIPIDKRAEQIMRAMQEDKLRFIHSGARAYYSPAGDIVVLPPREAFKSVEGYYGTVLHEIGHATGAASRLNRDAIVNGCYRGSDEHAREELRAELFSAFIAAETGIPHHDEQHRAYLQAWAEVLKRDKNEIFRAASAASKAVDYVLGMERNLQMKQEQAQQIEASPPSLQAGDQKERKESAMKRAEIVLNGWAGTTRHPVEIIGETPARYRVRILTPGGVMLPSRYASEGSVVLVPKHAVRQVREQGQQQVQEQGVGVQQASSVQQAASIQQGQEQSAGVQHGQEQQQVQEQGAAGLQEQQEQEKSAADKQPVRPMPARSLAWRDVGLER